MAKGASPSDPAATPPKPTQKTIDVFRRTPSAWVGDFLRRIGVTNCEIRGLRSLRTYAEGMTHLAGPAVTIRYVPVRYMRNSDQTRVEDLVITRLHNMNQEGILGAGDVLVLAADGAPYAFWGGHANNEAVSLELSGIVIDGCFRDISSIRESGINLFAAGSSFNRFEDRYEVVGTQVPVVCGGATVFPGDFIVGDEDGVVVIPREALDQVFAGIKVIEESESTFEKIVDSHRQSR